MRDEAFALGCCRKEDGAYGQEDSARDGEGRAVTKAVENQMTSWVSLAGILGPKS